MNQRLKIDRGQVAKHGKGGHANEANGAPHRGSNGHAAPNGRHASNSLGRAIESTSDASRALTSLLMSLAREMFSVDDAVSDLPLRQLRVCALLCECPLSMTVLGRKLGVTLSAMTQIADRLERAGLVKRTFAGTDRRMRCLQLTSRGQRIMRARENARVERAATALTQLDSCQQGQVIAALELLLEASMRANRSDSNA